MEKDGRARRQISGRIAGRALCVAAVIFTILTGCAKTSWTVPAGGEQQFRRDAVACQRDAAAQSPAPRPVSLSHTGFVHPTADYTMAPRGLPDELGTDALVSRCMVLKGYRRQ